MWFDNVTDLLGTGTTGAKDIIGALGQTEAEKNKARAAQAEAAAKKTNAVTWAKVAPWAIGIAAVLVIAFVFLKRRR